MKFTQIHEDDRGSISTMTGLQYTPEVTVFKTLANYARGGCIHRQSNEFCVVIEGEIQYVIGSTIRKMQDGDGLCIPKSTPHYFVALTDCVVMEWGPLPEEKVEKVPEVRAIVDQINKVSAYHAQINQRKQ